MFNHKNVDLSFYIHHEYVDIQNNADDLIALVDFVINTFEQNQNITARERQQNISRLLFIRSYFKEQKEQQQLLEINPVNRPR